MVESSKNSKKSQVMGYSRVGTGRMADLADIRDLKKPTGEETKEEIIEQNVDMFPKSEIVEEKVRLIKFRFDLHIHYMEIKLNSFFRRKLGSSSVWTKS